MLTPVKGIEAARFFAATDSPAFFSEMVKAVLGDTRIQSGMLHLGASVTTILAKTANADCTFSAGTDSQAEPILFVDLSLVELIQLVLTIVLPKVVPLSESKRQVVVERILFHAACVAGAYSVLDEIAPSTSMLSFGDKAFSQSIGLRTMVAVDCLAGHELGHWMQAKNIEDADITPGFQSRIRELALAGVSRMEAAHRVRYSADELDPAIAAVRSSLDYWWGEGWPEIVCDLQSMRSAWLAALDVNVPVASYAATIATLHQLTSAIGLAGAVIRGHSEAFGPRSSARSVVFESVIRDMAETIGVPADTWKHAVQFRKRANRRFVDLVATPLLERAEQLSAVYAESKRPPRQNIIASMARHGFAPRPSGHFHFCETGRFS